MSPEAMMVEFDAQIVPILKRLGLPSPDLDVELCETPAVVAYKAWREFPGRTCLAFSTPVRLLLSRLACLALSRPVCLRRWLPICLPVSRSVLME